MPGDDDRRGVAFFCDLRGIISQVVLDDFGIFADPPNAGNFTRYIVKSSQESAITLFNKITKDGSASALMIVFEGPDSICPLFCSGFRWKDRFFLAGTSSVTSLGHVLAKTLCSVETVENRVDLVTIRREAGASPSDSPPDTRFYDDFTRLNNELVNTQRQLVDFQMEIEMQNDELNREIGERRKVEETLKKYGEKLQASNEELQRFAYVASHDLQEPLRSIVSFSQLLDQRYRGRLDTDADEYIGYIVDGGQRMQMLIKDLLQFSQIETKAGPLAPADTREVVTRVLRVMEISIREASATVTVGDLPLVMADAIQLERVFMNLIGNALKYRRPDIPPAIQLSAEREGKFWRFAVKDNGIGIAPENLDRIFVIFQRLHTRNEYEGTGIGLAIVKKIVERHGGRIRVESTPGEGSMFFFTLPAV